MTRVLRFGPVVLALLGVFALGFTLGQLQDGIGEIPHHWWSTAPVVLVAGAAALWLARRQTTA